MLGSFWIKNESDKRRSNGLSIIGNYCLIENFYIGSYTSVGRSSKIVNSSVGYSVILEGPNNRC